MPDINLPLPVETYTGEEPFIFVRYSHKDGTVSTECRNDYCKVSIMGDFYMFSTLGMP